MVTQRFVLALVLAGLAACADVPAVDDPKMTTEFAEAGACNGSPALCEYRPTSQCSDGCTMTTGCYSPVLATCASLTSATCASNAACELSVSCQPRDTCEINSTETECRTDPINSCLWGAACTGYSSTECFNTKTAASCAAVPGCTWSASG